MLALENGDYPASRNDMKTPLWSLTPRAVVKYAMPPVGLQRTWYRVGQRQSLELTPSAIAIDNGDGIALTGTDGWWYDTYHSYSTMLLQQSTGLIDRQIIWSNGIYANTNYASANDICADYNGDFIVTGFSHAPNSAGWDVVTAAYGFYSGSAPIDSYGDHSEDINGVRLHVSIKATIEPTRDSAHR